MNSRDAINIAIIGTADEGVHLITALRDCHSTNIVGFCDSNTGAPNALIAQEFNVPLFERIEQLPSIGDVDIIIDASGGEIAFQETEGLGDAEIIRGKSARAISALIKNHRKYREDIDDIFAAGFNLASQKVSQDIYRSIVESAIKITGGKTGSLVIFNEDTDVCRLADVIGYSKELANGYSWEIQPGGITEHLLDRKGPLFIPDVNEEPLFDNPIMNEGTISVIATTLREADEVIGLLFVGDFTPREFSDREIELFYTFANQASFALQKALLLERNEELSVTDSLTGLNNSRHFYSTLDMEVKRARRYGGFFSTILIGLDNFSNINDCFGRAKGDWALKKVAKTIISCSRQTDYKARYGGDEFVLILPNTSCEQASVLANRIRRQINEIIVEGNEESMRLSASIGIAEFPCLGTDSDSLVTAVSTALTICKQRGRNLVCCYDNTTDGAS